MLGRIAVLLFIEEVTNQRTVIATVLPRYGLGDSHPNIDIVKRYKELGGKIITVGSDAHRVEHLANYFEIAYGLLELNDIDEVCVYHNRKPDFVKIKDLRR